MDKGLREYKNKIYSIISTIETFGGLKIALRMLLKDLGYAEEKQKELIEKCNDQNKILKKGE